jgi:3-oxoacyl-[acyl-carrier protein] reductase
VRAIAREAGRYGITSNAISLSALAPPLDDAAAAQFLASDQAKAILSRYVIRRFGRPDDVANMTLFLCSEAASWITGQTYPVNGGYSLSI